MLSDTKVPPYENYEYVLNAIILFSSFYILASSFCAHFGCIVYIQLAVT